MKIESNYPLQSFNTFKIDVKARQFASFKSVEELQFLISNISNQSLLILGGGSNILFTKDFDGLLLKNEIMAKEVVREDEDHIYIKAGAGENWHEFVSYCVKNNYAGIENLSLIPGNIGASPMQNIGAYGVEIKDVFEELEAFHINDKIINKFTLSDCHFGYRESVFKNKFKGQYVITSVTYRLNKKPLFNTSYGAIEKELENMAVKELSIDAISKAVINIRTSKLPNPKIIGNAGSFFKNAIISENEFNALKLEWPGLPYFPTENNNIKIPAGWLIEQCGWKGFRRGDAGCYSKQALVLVNYGNASGSEIFELSCKIIDSVKNKFNIKLETEVNIF